MGNFKIEIEAVGNHGYDRTHTQGQAIDFGEASASNPDGMAKLFVEQLGECNSVVSATLTHWPNAMPIVDDLKGGIRLARDFSQEWQGEPILQFFAFHHLPPQLQDISKSFCHAAYAIVAALPRNPERTVALRKLLEANDAAVRAAIAK
ncbi:MAG TPA: hypothetical protein VGF94_08405 [Kofleriaceae bacterium]|jgi:hypothetical protein